MTFKNNHNKFSDHPGFSNVFKPGKLTLGLMAPFKGYSEGIPDLDDFSELAEMADKSNIAALWIRDVPAFDPKFGDAAQIYDPATSLGYLAARTENITLGTAGYISTLRHPIHIAKEAASLDKLSGGRFLLGLASGDRKTEYPAFNEDYENRSARYREAFQLIRKLHRENYPSGNTDYYGTFSGDIDFLPKPDNDIPIISIGRAEQMPEWTSNNPDAWIWHGLNPKDSGKIVHEIDKLNETGNWKPFGYANAVHLLEDSNAPLKIKSNMHLTGGSKSIVEHFKEQEEMGLSHVSINFHPNTDRPSKELMHQFIEEVAAYF